MKLKLLAAALAAAGAFAAPAQAQKEIQWWHSMGGALGERSTEELEPFKLQVEGAAASALAQLEALS